MRSSDSGQEPLVFKPFDVTTKQLVETDPAAWLEYIGLPLAPVRLVDADLSTIAVEADKVLRVETVPPFLLNLEFQASYDALLGERTLLYSVLLRRRHGLPVHSVVILLRLEADGPAMNGQVQYGSGPFVPGYALEFRYAIFRIWEQPVESLLSGRLALLPLAPLAAVSEAELPRIIEQMQERIRQEASPDAGRTLWAATFLLMGLRFDAAFIGRLLEGVQDMEESSTYQLLLARGREQGRVEGEAKGLAEGEVREARALLLRIGRNRLGEPDAEALTILEAISSLERLEQMADRLLQVETWQELLTPQG